MLTWTLSFILGTRAQSLSARFSYTLYIICILQMVNIMGVF
jgi:hypothetical protein